MTQQDRGAFAEAWTIAAETYREPMSAARMEAYFTLLADLTLAEVKGALQAHMLNSEFFPKPADIRRGIQGSVEDRAALAWTGLLKMVRRFGYYRAPAISDWDDPAMRKAAYELYGGWTSLCERLPSEGPGLAVAAKHFQQTYAAYARTDQVAALTAGEEQRELSADEARKALGDLMRRPENIKLLAKR